MMRQMIPREAYLRVEIDARIVGGGGKGLVVMCFDEVIAAIDRAIFASNNGRKDLRATALSRAAAGLSALKKGVDIAAPIGPALLELYDAALGAIVGAMSRVNDAVLQRVKQDLTEIYSAMLD